MNKNDNHFVEKTTDAFLDEAENVVSATGQKIEKMAAPIRENVLMRFPILFMLTVTFGVTATFTGVEQILLKYQVLSNNPWLILFLGIGMLVLTGTLYKKLQ